MKYLPYEQINLKTNLSGEEITEILQNQTEPWRSIWTIGFGYTGYYFQGVILKNGFKIRRIIDDRNIFLPNIKGTINPDEQGNSIKIIFSLPIIILLFWSVWMGIVILFALLILIILIGGGSFNGFLIIPFVMMFFGYLICILPFNKEIRISKRYLGEILKAIEK
jgi:hypothetical protein